LRTNAFTTLMLLASLILSGCGWQLRGTTELSPALQVMHLNSQASNRFNQYLRLQLEYSGVLLTQSASDAPVQLWVNAPVIERRELSVGEDGQVSEYELNGRLSARLLRPSQDSEVVYELEARRIFANDINNVTGTANTEREQHQALHQDLASQLLRRLQFTQLDTP
jgi:LPS-assembly lipoprotein